MWGSVSFAQTGDAFYFGHISEPVFHYFYLKKLNQYFLLLPETLFTQASELQRVCGLKVLANAKFFSEYSEIVFVVKHNGKNRKQLMMIDYHLKLTDVFKLLILSDQKKLKP